MNQFLATRGYAVLQVNYRGSSGYGAAYQAAGLRSRLDTVVLDDLADGAEFLIKAGKVDSKRVAMVGGSFGGWATYMSLAKYPELYRAGVAIAAISHWKDVQRAKRWDRSSEISYVFWQSVLGGDRFSADEKYIDPRLRSAEIKQPIYVMHGNYDDIVPEDQAEQMVDALQKTNPNVRFMRFPLSSHTWWPLADQVTLMNEIGAFLKRTLPPGGT
jgi:dipeptidyl aminopeptidase/acylaminoacyl peptidase